MIERISKKLSSLEHTFLLAKQELEKAKEMVVNTEKELARLQGEHRALTNLKKELEEEEKSKGKEAQE